MKRTFAGNDNDRADAYDDDAQDLFGDADERTGNRTAPDALLRGVTHIAHATECLAGGTLAVLRQATAELARMRVRQTIVFSRRPDTPADVPALFPPGVNLIEVPAARGVRGHLAFTVGFVRGLRRLLEVDPPQLLHLHSSKAGFIGRLAMRSLARRDDVPPIRLLYSPHGLSFLNPLRPWSSSVYWALERLAGLVPCEPIGCGASEAKALSRVAGRNAFVLENAVDPEFFEIERREPDRPVIVTVGRVCEQKGPELFAELAVRAHLDADNAHFVWVGSGDPEQEALLRAVGVEVTGWVTQEQVRERLAEATIYVQTSRWEGMSLAVLQAMAAGLPCVVLDAVGNRDAVAHDETGFVAGDADELEMYLTLLIENPQLRQHLGRRARDRALRRFSRARFRSQLVRLYGLERPATLELPTLQPLPGRNAPATLS